MAEQTVFLPVSIDGAEVMLSVSTQALVHSVNGKAPAPVAGLGSQQLAEFLATLDPGEIQSRAFNHPTLQPGPDSAIAAVFLVLVEIMAEQEAGR